MGQERAMPSGSGSTCNCRVGLFIPPFLWPSCQIARIVVLYWATHFLTSLIVLSMSDTIISKPRIEIADEVKAFVQTEEARTTIVHCRIFSPLPTLARIWKTVYLVEDDGHKVKLIKAFNISIAPNWTLFIVENSYIHFTLLFEGLSKSCASFYVYEDIPEPGSFYSKTIFRNKTDVYDVELFSQ